MEKFLVAPGIYWVNITEANLRILCGAPMDAVKHLKRRGLIRPVEKKGIQFETGPNAILLSDLSMQGGDFSNLSEFPILHMIYKQGLSIEGHPNYSSKKPLLIGSKNQVNAQKEYIFLGNIGLYNQEMLTDADLPEKYLKDLWNLKLNFNQGGFKKSDDFLDSLIIGEENQEIRNDVYIKRVDANIFQFTYRDEVIQIDLNLKSDQTYQSPFYLNYHRVKREYFSIIHSGEGNGWDHERPCMGSVITYLGKFYLIDTGPNITAILRSLGICLNHVEGIFQTHAHDDHFAGLTSLMRSSHKIKYYAAKSVRLTVQKKMASLLGRDESIFSRIFDVNDLEVHSWNNVNGLEVLPLLSPHPLETTIFYFRTMGRQGYKTYGHLADIITKSTLKSFTQKENPISMDFFNEVWDNYLITADIKKIDTGRGFVHGRAEDFDQDKSLCLLLSHKDNPLTPKEKEIGSNATFGQQDVLIPALDNFDVYYAREQLSQYFPESPIEDIQLLMNNPLVRFAPGSIILKNGQVPKSVFLISSGFTEYIHTKENVSITLTAGSLIGEMPALLDTSLKGTYRAACYVRALEIPSRLFAWFIKKNQFYEDIKLLHRRRSYIYEHPILGGHLSYPLQSKIARTMTELQFKAGDIQNLDGKGNCLYIIRNGKARVSSEKLNSFDIGPGDPFGITNVLRLLDSETLYVSSATFMEDTDVYAVPTGIIKDSPHLQWTLLERYESRIN